MLNRQVARWCLLIAVTGCLIGLSSCDSERPPPDPSTQERTTSLHASVLPESAGPRLLDQCSRPTPKRIRGFWTPSPSLVAELEDDISEFLASVNSSKVGHRSGVTMIGDYRQYVGIVRWNGRRAIYINGFSHDYLISLNKIRTEVAKNNAGISADSVKWRLVPINVCDGGAAFWGLEYDPSNKEFSNFRFNDSAG